LTRTRLRNLPRYLPAVAVACALAACGGPVTSAPPVKGGQSSPTNPAAEKIGQGFTITTVSGTRYLVYLTKVIDPAQGADSVTIPDKGQRFVGLVFTLKGVSGTSSGNSNSNATLTASNGLTYQADFQSIKGWTNFGNGEFHTNPGTRLVGAVTFQIPAGVKVTEVQWSATGGFGGTSATWAVRP